MDTNTRIRQNIAATLGNLLLQQIEMQAVIEDQQASLAAMTEAKAKRDEIANFGKKED